MTHTLPRVIALWIPDWPIHACRVELATGQDSVTAISVPVTNVTATTTTTTVDRGTAGAPIALLTQQRVVACSASARAEGVRIGLRQREAQARCPNIEFHAHNPEADTRHFTTVLAAVEALIPEVENVRPGLCVMRARGPARYFGSEAEAAAAILDLTTSLGFGDARVGVACGKFAAEQAARAASTDPAVSRPGSHTRIVHTADTLRFLSSLPVARACDPALADTLHGLGISTLGSLSALPESAIRERFGAPGVAAHRLASAQQLDTRGPLSEVTPRSPPPVLTVEIDFDPPLNGSDQLAFACSTLAENFVSNVSEHRLVCTELRVELTDDIGVRHERSWAHPRQFTDADVLNRVRWQAESLPTDSNRESAGIARVRLTPTRTDAAAAHEPGLWSSEPDARVHHHLHRTQSLLGHEGVATAELVGGRLSRERFRLIPWGTRTPGGAHGARSTNRTRVRDAPWPGGPLAPLPSTVFSQPLPAKVHDAAGNTLEIDDDDFLIGAPHTLLVTGFHSLAPALEWSAPWPIRELWWIGRPERFRLQLLLRNGDAWLLLYSRRSWFAEGRYD